MQLTWATCCIQNFFAGNYVVRRSKGFYYLSMTFIVLKEYHGTSLIIQSLLQVSGLLLDSGTMSTNSESCLDRSFSIRFIWMVDLNSMNELLVIKANLSPKKSIDLDKESNLKEYNYTPFSTFHNLIVWSTLLVIKHVESLETSQHHCGYDTSQGIHHYVHTT